MIVENFRAPLVLKHTEDYIKCKDGWRWILKWIDTNGFFSIPVTSDQAFPSEEEARADLRRIDEDHMAKAR